MRADRAQVDVRRANGAERLREREGHERLARPAREVVDRERPLRRKQDELGRDRRHLLPRPLADERHEALREETRLRDPALALDEGERLLARIDAGEAARDVGLDRRREVGRAFEPDRPRPVVAHPRHELVRDAAVERRACGGRDSGARRGAARSSSRSTRAPRPRRRSGRCSSSNRFVPRSIARSRAAGSTRVNSLGDGHAESLADQALRMC